MNVEQWERTKQTLEQALRLPAAERAQFLDLACGGDHEFRAEVESLISSHEEASTKFLGGNAFEVLALETAAASSQIRVGQLIGQYRVVSEIGRGGMGIVYKAEDTRLQRRVALKFLPAEIVSDPHAFERFEQEARAASALDHANICVVYQLGEHESKPFIVMQLLEGQTLREWIQGHNLRPNLVEVLDFAIQIAEGLDAAHAHGIIHRDIKPANIFISKRNQIKILDFGLAKFVEKAEVAEQHQAEPLEGFSTFSGDLTLTKTGVLLGTPSYSSPEQIRREKLDARTDVFSFGLVLYEMTCGKAGVTGDTIAKFGDTALKVPVVPVRQINPEVPPALERVISKMLEEDRNRRYQTAGEVAAELQQIRQQYSSPLGLAHRKHRITVWSDWIRQFRLQILAVAGVLFVLAVAGGIRHYLHVKATKLTAKDTILIADFSNNTGDVVFDSTLRKALTVALGQSPFLNLLPEQKIRGMLREMTKAVNTPVVGDLAREVCERSHSKAYVAGAIAALGSEYVIGLKAENCANGELLGEEQVTAKKKEDVISTLGEASTRLRGKLGESIASIRNFDVPLREATTSSLDALKVYTTGGQVENEQGASAAIPYYKKAIELDPHFARAYGALSGVYFDAGESALAARYASKAYELRNYATEFEKIQIAANYHGFATGNLEKEAQAYEQWAQFRPNSSSPYSNLDYIYAQLGFNDKALNEILKAHVLGPSGEIFNNLISSYVAVGRLKEAKAAFSEAEVQHMSLPINHINLYQIAFLEHDQAAMNREAAWAMGKPEVKAGMLYWQAGTSGYYGELKRSRDYTHRASAAALAQNEKEVALSYRVYDALREVLFGNSAEAKRELRKEPIATGGQDVQAAAAFAYSFAGDRIRAKTLGDKLAQQFPENTIVQSNYLPVIRAEIALADEDPANAIEILKAALPFELGQPAQIIALNLYPIYVRALAYQAEHDGAAAAKEFKKIVNAPGMALNEPIAVLAHLGLARAYGLQGNKNQARSEYEQFLALWKNADANIPVLKEAKAEYAQSQN